MRVLGRVLRYFFAVVFGLLGLSLLLVLWLALTTSGARLVAQVAESQEPRLEVQVTGGSLATGVDLAEIRWQDEGVDVGVDEVSLRWRPQDLLDGQLFIGRLQVRGVDVALDGADPVVEAEETPPRTEAIELPEIELPLGIQVERLEIERVRVATGDGTAQRVERLEAALTAQGTHWQLHRLLVEREDARLEVDGALHTTGAYPVSLLARGSGALPGLPERIRFTSRFGGSVAALHTSTELDGPIQGGIDLDLRPLEPDLPFYLQTRSVLAGWPLDSREIVFAEGLDLVARGSLDGVEGNLQTEVDGEFIPRGRWRADLDGDLDGLSLTAIRGELLGGRLSGQAELGWGPDGVRWDVDADADGLDAGMAFDGAPGGLEGPLSVSGQAGGEGWGLMIATPGIGGELQGRPFELRGRVENTLADAWHFDGIELEADGGRARVNGELAEDWDLDVEADFEDLSALDDRLAGSVVGQARLRGAPEALDIRTEGEGRGLAWEAYRLSALRWSAQVPELGQQPGEARVTLEEIELPQGVIESVELTGLGTQAAHHLALRAEAPAAEAGGRLAVAGGWQPEHGWQGLVVDAGGAFRDHAVDLDRPFAISYAAQRLEVSPHCWGYREAGICLTEGLEAGPDGAAVDFRLRDFDLAWVEPYLPPDVTWVGSIGGDGGVRWDPDDGVRARVAAESLDGMLGLTLHGEFDDEDPVFRDLAYHRLALRASYEPEHAEAELHFETPEAGDAAIRLGGDPRPDGERIEGRIQVDDLRLAFFRPFVPDLRELEGGVGADVQVSGTRQEPGLEGYLALAEGRLGVAESPTDLEDLRVRVDLAGTDAEIGGGFRMGEGAAELNGEAGWRDADWFFDLDLLGDELFAEVPPYGQIRVSPRMDLRVRPEDVRVGGRIGIPWADIQVRELPQRVVGVSRDVVVTRPVPEDEEALEAVEELVEPWSVTADVEVVLGDAVALNAFGLRGRLSGALRVLQREDGNTEAFGELSVVDGEYRAYGQRLQIRRGLVLFTGPIDRPQLDVEAVRTITRDRVTAGIRIEGFTDDLQLSLFSEPPMSDEDALSYIVRGRPMGAEGPGTDEMLASAAVALGLYGGTGALTSVAERAGIQDFEIDTAGEGEDAQVVVSGYLTPRLYLAYGVAVFSPVNTVTLRYYLTWQLYLEAISGEDSALDLMYRFEID